VRQEPATRAWQRARSVAGSYPIRHEFQQLCLGAAIL